MKHGQTVLRSEDKLAVSRYAATLRAEWAQLISGQTVRFRVIAEDAIARIEMREARMSGEPKISMPVLQNRFDRLVREAVLHREGGEGSPGTVHPRKPLSGTDPQGSGVILIDGIHGIVDETAGLIGVAVSRELLRSPVKAVQPAIGSNPKYSLPVLHNDLRVILGQAMGISGTIAVGAKMSGLRVEPVQPTAAGARPHHALTVTQQGQHAVATQAARVAAVMPVRNKPFFAGIETVQSTAISTHPHRARASFAQPARALLSISNKSRPPLDKAADAFSAACPDDSFRIFKKRFDLVVA